MSWSQRMSERDEQMARGKYAGRESATERAARKTREENAARRDRRAGQARNADRAGAAWEDKDRRRNG